MKTKLTEKKFKSVIGFAGWLVSRIACLGAVILICTSASAQNLFVSEYNPDDRNCNEVGYCGNIVKFTWDGTRSVFASNLIMPEDLAFDSAGNLYVVAEWHAGIYGGVVIDKIAPDGTLSGFASGSSLPLHLAGDKAGNLFVAESSSGVIYKYKPDGSRTTFASGLYQPVGMAVDSTNNLFVVNNTDGIHQGSIYEYHPDGSRVTFAVLGATDRPAALASNGLWFGAKRRTKLGL
jgi:DNA-binding beta-propeller fold protein YncE